MSETHTCGQCGAALVEGHDHFPCFGEQTAADDWKSLYDLARAENELLRQERDGAATIIESFLDHIGPCAGIDPIVQAELFLENIGRPWEWD